MVLLGLRFMLFKNFPKRAKTFTERVHQGIYHGKGYMYGHVNTLIFLKKSKLNLELSLSVKLLNVTLIYKYIAL